MSHVNDYTVVFNEMLFSFKSILLIHLLMLLVLSNVHTRVFFNFVFFRLKHIFFFIKQKLKNLKKMKFMFFLFYLFNSFHFQKINLYPISFLQVLASIFFFSIFLSKIHHLHQNIHSPRIELN